MRTEQKIMNSAISNDNSTATPITWAAAIIACRESFATVSESVQAVALAERPANTVITVDLIVNGNDKLAEQAAALAHASVDGLTVRVWRISRGDKAHAWNEYVHHIWPGASTTFFIDGYVRINRDALSLLDAALRDNPDCLAATGVPTEGRTANAHRASMIAGGGLHGNLHAIRQSAMDEIRTIGFRLPVGLYRTDSLIGGAMAFRFAPAQFPWNVRLCYVAATASWSLINMPKGVYSLLSTYWKRKLRQSQGQLENLAVQEHMAFKLRPPQELPTCNRELVLGYVQGNRAKVRKIVLKNPLIGYALYKVAKGPRVAAMASVTRLMNSGGERAAAQLV